ncbi:MAG: sensor domain-containing diguanylate cyclase [Alphaproteobacteria bacterium]
MVTHEILYVNQRAQALVGDVVGRCCWDIAQPDGSGPCTECPRHAIVGRDGAPNGTYVHQRHHGMTGRWSECRHQAVRLEGGRLAHVETITELSQRRPAPNRPSAEMYLQIAATMVVALDAGGRITLANPKACAVLGYEEDELLGRLWTEIATPGDRADRHGRAGRPLIPVVDYHEDELVTRDGRRRIVAWRTSLVIDDEGLVGGSLNLGEDITERREIEDNLRFLARHDTLTGLANGEELEHRLNDAIARARRARVTVGVLYLDIDGFGAVNADLGQDVGDALLCGVADRLRRVLREVDVAARMGGDEFAVVLEGPSDWAVSVRVAEKVIAALGRPFDVCGREVTVTANVGIVIYPTDGTNARLLLRDAYRALRTAKDVGRSAYFLWHQEAC